MNIVILTFQGFNEIDSLVAVRMLKWLDKKDWTIKICCPSSEVTSIGGLTIKAQGMIEEASIADAVILGSGMMTREIIKDESIMSRINLDPHRQLIGAQCSGALMLAALGVLRDIPACTDLSTKPWVQEAGIEVLNQPFFAKGGIATAGGCLSSAYLAAWIIAKLADLETTKQALFYFAPVGEKEEFVANAIKRITPYL
jgi:transcriptional regulator GlxA family with amidase domain